MTSAASGAHEKLSFNTVNITQGGYLYVFVSNESNTDFEVYFDNLNITHTKGAILQEDHYYPFGANISALSSTAPLSKPNRFKLSGNEEQTDFDLNLHDFNARFYDQTLGRFINVDPMADERVWVNPYNYVQNNPLILVDPMGTIDDYFDRDGNYLGSDELESDVVRVVDKEDWEKNKTTNDDGTESINSTEGHKISTKHSEAGLSTKASLNIYQHYNPTDLKLEAPMIETGNKSGMAFRLSGKKSSPNTSMVVQVKGNHKTGVSDHANEITNIFVHEEKHYNDYKSSGSYDAFKAIGDNRLEIRAVQTQMNHSSFSKTRSSFQKAAINYGVKHGMIMPIQPRYSPQRIKLPSFKRN